MGKEDTKVYLRFPTKIKEELEVKILCPNISAVHLPRQKSARWCVVEFDTPAKKEEGLAVLKTVLIKDKPVIIKKFKKKLKKDKNKKCDEVDSLHDLLTQ